MSIAFVEAQYGHPTSSGSVNMGSPIAIGDLMMVFIQVNFSTTSVTSLTFTDSTNSGNYTVLGNLVDSGNENQYTLAYKVCNAAQSSSTLVSCAQLNGQGSTWSVAHYNGFLGVATPSGDFTQVNTPGFTSSANVAATSFNTSKSNELVCAFGGSGAGWATAPAAPWTQRGTFNSASYLYDQIVTTPGTAIQFTGTLASAQTWWVTQVGFYDLSGVVTPSAGGVAVTGQQPVSSVGTRLTPNTAKVRDAVRRAARSIFLPPRPLICG